MTIVRVTLDASRVQIARKLKSTFKKIARRRYEKSSRVYVCFGAFSLVISCNDIPEFFDLTSSRGICAVYSRDNRCAEPATNKKYAGSFRRFIRLPRLKEPFILYFSAQHFVTFALTHVREICARSEWCVLSALKIRQGGGGEKQRSEKETRAARAFFRNSFTKIHFFSLRLKFPPSPSPSRA